jgi:hypothetical protein
MTRSEAKEACKKNMIAEIRVQGTPACEDCNAAANTTNGAGRGCAACVLIAEEWDKLQVRIVSLLRKEIAAAFTRKSENEL